MKKSISFVFLCVIMIFCSFVMHACSEEKDITSYYIDSNNNLVAVCEDNIEINLGTWGEDIIQSITSISVSSDGYYIINGVKTEIAETTPIAYYLDSQSNLIAKYADNDTKNLGQFGQSIIPSLGTVTVSTDCYYIINGIKTGIKAKVPASYSINSKGQLVVTYKDNTIENLGDISKTLANGVQIIEISEDGNYKINGVTTTIKATDVFTVAFNTGFSKKIDSQKVKDGYKVEKPSLIRTGYTLSGWLCNDEEWRFNSDVVQNDMALTAEWTANSYTVSFIDSKGSNPETMSVTYDDSVTLPTVSPIDGYTFAGWYNGDTKVENGKWSIASDTTLTAKWTRDTYTVSLNTDGGNTVLPIIVDSYSTIEILPIPTKEDYEFLGWYLLEEPFNLPYEFTKGNIQLKAHWKGINEKFDFTEDNVGTGIKITNYKLDEENVVIPDTIAKKTVTTICTSAFKDKTNIKIIDFGKAVNFEYKAIDNCNSIEEIQLLGESATTLTYIFGNNANIPNSLKVITFKTNSTTFGDGLFSGVSGHLFRVNAYANITNAPADAFYQCDVIESIYFSDTITKFGNRVVCACDNLTYVKLPSFLQSVGMNNFMNCSIKYIIFPNTLTSSDYGGLCSSGVILVESKTRPAGWSSGAFTIYEEKKSIFYGFESLHETDDFLYALCKVGITKQCVIIQRYNSSILYPEFIDGYPVTFTNNDYTKTK